MAKKKVDKWFKKDVVNVLLALGASLIAYFSFNYFNPSTGDMLSAVIFILILILLKLTDKK